MKTDTDTSAIAQTFDEHALGLLGAFGDSSHPSSVYSHRGPMTQITIPGNNTAYGLAFGGHLFLQDRDNDAVVMDQGEYFSFPFENSLKVTGSANAMIAVRHGYTGLNSRGGPPEQTGRLKYIDGCSDTLLIGPPLKGDPCFNLLKFPADIDQTMHTHPTIRAGMILDGEGICRTPVGDLPLIAGNIFMLHPDAEHAFSTKGTDGMRLTVFHPDTDTGPSHDDHPMLNRTIVDGVSASQIDEIKTKEIT